MYWQAEYLNKKGERNETAGIVFPLTTIRYAEGQSHQLEVLERQRKTARGISCTKRKETQMKDYQLFLFWKTSKGQWRYWNMYQGLVAKLNQLHIALSERR